MTNMASSRVFWVTDNNETPKFLNKLLADTNGRIEAMTVSHCLDIRDGCGDSASTVLVSVYGFHTEETNKKYD